MQHVRESNSNAKASTHQMRRASIIFFHVSRVTMIASPPTQDIQAARFNESGNSEAFLGGLDSDPRRRSVWQYQFD